MIQPIVEQRSPKINKTAVQSGDRVHNSSDYSAIDHQSNHCPLTELVNRTMR